MKYLQDIDFSKVKLVVFDFDGVFTENSVVVSEDGTESVICSRFDGVGVRLLDQVGVLSTIMSAETNVVVSKRAKKIRINCIQAVEDKGAEIKKLCANLKVSLDQTVYLGNDINDIPALKLVGFPIAVADSWPQIFQYCIAITQVAGGKGAVRELCAQIHKQKEVYDNEIK